MKRYIISPGGHPAVLRFEESPVGTWVKAEEAIASRRERIATAALQGLLSADIGRWDPDERSFDFDFPLGEEAWTAKIACRFADALIAELDKSTEGGGA